MNQTFTYRFQTKTKTIRILVPLIEVLQWNLIVSTYWQISRMEVSYICREAKKFHKQFDLFFHKYKNLNHLGITHQLPFQFQNYSTNYIFSLKIQFLIQNQVLTPNLLLIIETPQWCILIHDLDNFTRSLATKVDAEPK